jgi:preprotein translocase subunit SecB
MQKSETFSVNSRCSYNLGFAGDGKLCRGTMTLEVTNKDDPDKFTVKVSVVGNFLNEDDAPKDDIHRASYKALFPHAKAMVTALTVAANIPPIFFPDIDIDSQSVYMFENPKK